MTISVTPAKLLRKWPASRSHASEAEVRSLIGKLLHLCEVVRPGRFFVGRMLDQLGLAPSQRWQDKWQSKLAASRGARASACGRGAHLVGSRVSRGRGILAVDRSVGYVVFCGYAGSAFV